MLLLKLSFQPLNCFLLLVSKGCFFSCFCFLGGLFVCVCFFHASHSTWKKLISLWCVVLKLFERLKSDFWNDEKVELLCWREIFPFCSGGHRNTFLFHSSQYIWFPYLLFFISITASEMQLRCKPVESNSVLEPGI